MNYKEALKATLTKAMLSELIKAFETLHKQAQRGEVNTARDTFIENINKTIQRAKGLLETLHGTLTERADEGVSVHSDVADKFKEHIGALSAEIAHFDAYLQASGKQQPQMQTIHQKITEITEIIQTPLKSETIGVLSKLLDEVKALMQQIEQTLDGGAQHEGNEP